MIKNFLAVALIAFTTLTIAQESVQLRLNYEEGDTYIMKMSMTQNMAVMDMNMEMDATIDITGVNEGIYDSKMKFTKIDMGMMQGGMEMGASTEDSDEDLDAMSKGLKGQLDQMMKVVLTAKTDKFGNVISMEAEPNIPGMEQMKNQSGSISYPEKSLRVGDSWTDEKTEQGMVIKSTYTVKSISTDTVDLTVSGVVSGIAEGKLNGETVVNKTSGVPVSSTMEMVMKVQGQDMKTNVSMTMEKVN